MFILRKEYRFEAAHFLPLVPVGHQCGRMHGHSYGVVIEVGSKILKKNGFVIDFADLNHYIQPIINKLDHQLLNDFIDNPTVENLCVYIADNFLASIEDYKYDERDQEIYLLAVEVSETLKTKCRYELKEVI